MKSKAAVLTRPQQLYSFEELVCMTDLDNAESSVRAVADGAYELDGRTFVKAALCPTQSQR
jgi:hypothetical protein